MILIVPILIGVTAIAVTGGRLTALLDLRFRHRWLLVAALATQLLILRVVPGATVWHEAGHLASYGLAAGFVVANRRLPHVLTLAVGGGLNLAAIAANGGTMPARAAAVVSAGLEHAANQFSNSAPVADARLAVLGDVFAIPASWPLSNTFSIGDIVLVAGAILLVNAVCRTRRTTVHPVVGTATA